MIYPQKAEAMEVESNHSKIRSILAIDAIGKECIEAHLSFPSDILIRECVETGKAMKEAVRLFGKGDRSILSKRLVLSDSVLCKSVLEAESESSDVTYVQNMLNECFTMSKSREGIDVDRFTWNSLTSYTTGLCIALVALLEKKSLTAAVLGRPPGHRCCNLPITNPNRFCFLNLAVIAFKTIFKRRNDQRRIIILDSDVHFGDGTAIAVLEFLQSNPEMKGRIVYAGTFIDKVLPLSNKRGIKEWEESVSQLYNYSLEDLRRIIMNRPMSMIDDEEFISTWKDIIYNLALQDDDVVIWSVGYDGSAKDPLQLGHLSEKGFRGMTEVLLNQIFSRDEHRVQSRSSGSERFPQLLVLIEGGYASDVLTEECLYLLKSMDTAGAQYLLLSALSKSLSNNNNFIE